MKKNFMAVICSLVFIAAAAVSLSGQLAAPTSAGVSLGAVYYTVPDVAAHKKIWIDIFGAKPAINELLAPPTPGPALAPAAPAKPSPTESAPAEAGSTPSAPAPETSPAPATSPESSSPSAPPAPPSQTEQQNPG